MKHNIEKGFGKKAGIYKIQSKTTNRFYIGSAKCLSDRIYLHKKLLKEHKHHNTFLQNHYNKYGNDDLLCSVVEYIEDTNLLIEREQYYIDNLNPEFNICRIAGNKLGTIHTEETKNKMKIKRIGRKPALGLVHSEEYKEILSKQLKGNKFAQKLTDEDVVKIKELKLQGLYQKDIAKLLNVTPAQISLIINNKSRKNS